MGCISYVQVLRETFLKGGWNIGILPRGVIGAYGPIGDESRISMVTI
jgi:hypothetical protein